MRRIRYCVAASLDGYIAGPKGEYDWIIPDPEVNFAELWAQFDTLLMGRRTYEVAVSRLGEKDFQGMKVVVVSRTIEPAGHPGITIISELNRSWVEELRARNGKDIWLMGGGELFRAFLEMGEVATVEVSVMPVLLGGGVKLLPSSAECAKLKLSAQKIYHSGIVSLVYEVEK